MGFEQYGNQIHIWMKGVFENRGINPEKTMEYCRRILDCGEKSGDEKLMGFACYYMGETSYLLNDVDRLFANMSRSLTYLENTGQHELVARAYNILAITSVNRGNAPFAMDYYLSALAYCEEHHLDDIGIMININIGTLYNQFGEYQKAQNYFECAYQILGSHSGVPDYHMLLMNIYTGMGNSFLYREQLPKAREYESRVMQECFDRLGTVEQVCFCCFQARLYHSMGKQTQRDACIARVQESIQVAMPLLDIFDDFYAYCEMLLSIGFDSELSVMLGWLEEQAKKMRMIYMQKRLLLIRIRFYRAKRDEKSYLGACARYCELTEISEKENRYMVSSILTMRSTLEETARKRREMERENALLQQKSETDALTGLANRFRLNDVSEEAFERAKEQQSGLGVEILDIDYFKQYNDNYGHQAGDVCIRNIAAALQSMEEHGSIFCARYGGDEFIVIYEGCTREQVSRLAEELRERIVALKQEHKYSRALPVVTVSQGICYDVPGEGVKVWDFLHTADRMLYKGKKISRNSIYIGYCGEE